MEIKELMERIKRDDVRFVSLQFTDVFGTIKSLDLPVSRVEEICRNGIWFDGSSVEGFTRIQESDMHLFPDIETYSILPWTPAEMRRARIICDIELPNGDAYLGDPRGVLKRICARLKEKGMIFNVGPEPEFFLFRANCDRIHPVPFDTGTYFDFSPDDAAVRIRSKLMLALDALGLRVELGHHECGLGQHEIDFAFDEAVRAADNIQLMKATVKAIAAQEGIVASFMPKPVAADAGSGMHCHQSIMSLDGENLFYDADDAMHLSQFGRYFIGGQLAHAKGLAGILNPTVNSYKRLVPGYEAPCYISWAQTNRSALIRIPSSNGTPGSIRAELRSPDPSCNPYLGLAAMLAAGLDGIEKKMDPGNPLNDVNVYELSRRQRREKGIEELPGSLREALLALENDPLFERTLGKAACEAHLRGRWYEWDSFRVSVSEWELDRYLDTV